MQRSTVISTSLDLPCRHGKVRDVYDLGQQLMIVSTDRISAFDWVLPTGIPQKGVVLTQISRFWFEHLNAESLDVTHHFQSTRIPDHLSLSDQQRNELHARTMIVDKAEVIPFECVVRGYLEGSGWKEYRDSGSICGIALPAGLAHCNALPEPIFTPATKAEEGHDENVTFEYMSDQLGTELAESLREKSLAVYQHGCQRARERGIIIADTKFEWGWHDGQVVLIDEVLTPDSSRFWPADNYQPGHPQPSLDKQFVREWLMSTDWDRNSTPPALPAEIVQQTRDKYVEVFQMLTQEDFSY